MKVPCMKLECECLGASHGLKRRRWGSERERGGRLLRLIDSFFSTLQRGESLTTWITCLLRQSGEGKLWLCGPADTSTMNVTHHTTRPTHNHPPTPASGPVESRDIMKSNFCFTFSPAVDRPVAKVAGVTRCFHPGVTFNFTHSCVTSCRPCPASPCPTVAHCCIDLLRRRFHNQCSFINHKRKITFFFLFSEQRCCSIPARGSAFQK